MKNYEKLTKFIEKSEAKFGEGKYDFSETDYVNNYTKVKIRCNTCGQLLEISPSHFLIAGGCPCQREYKKAPRLSTEVFIQRAERLYGQGTYGYDRVDYVNSYTKVWIYCPKCGEYVKVHPATFLDPKKHPGCPKCGTRMIGQKLRTPQDEWIRRAEEKWGDICDYSETVYEGTNKPVRIFCKEHNGFFEQLPSTHLRSAYGCPICSLSHTAKSSIPETLIDKILSDMGCTFTREYILSGVIHGRNSDIVRIDFRIQDGDKEIWIEYHGEQHFRNVPFFGHGDPDWYAKQLQRDQNIRDYCISKGILLIEIPYTYNEESELHQILEDIIKGGLDPKSLINYPDRKS